MTLSFSSTTMTICDSQRRRLLTSAVSKYWICTIPHQTRHLNSLTYSQWHSASCSQITIPIGKGKVWPLCHKGTWIPRGRKEENHPNKSEACCPAVWNQRVYRRILTCIRMPKKSTKFGYWILFRGHGHLFLRHFRHTDCTFGCYCVAVYLGSSTETAAFQVYKILKIDHEFLQFFWLGSKI